MIDLHVVSKHSNELKLVNYTHSNINLISRVPPAAFNHKKV